MKLGGYRNKFNLINKLFSAVQVIDYQLSLFVCLFVCLSDQSVKALLIRFNTDR